MRIVYLGTPEFSVAPLKKLIECGYNVVAVVTNKDKPVGRKKVITPPPVKVFATEHDIPVYQYDRIRLEGVEDIKNLNPDLLITCAFGQILSQEILDVPKLGVLNIHASLLPKYRGASPIHYAILNGEKQTGITIMKTDIGIDTGDMLLQQTVEIGDDETCGELFSKLSVVGAECIVKALELVESGEAEFIKQDNDLATLTKIIKKEDALIDWADSAINIFNKIRAFNPSPIAFCYLCGQPFKIYKARLGDKKGETGHILSADKTLEIACGEGSLILEVVQKAGGSAMNISDFLRGNKFVVGEKFV